MHGGIEEALVLMLPAEVNGRSHRCRKLANRRHAPIYLDTASPGCLDTTPDHTAIWVPVAQEQASLDLERIGALAHSGGIGTLSHQQFYCAEESGFACTRLAGQYGKPRRGSDGRLTYERDVAHEQLVNHGMPR